MKTFKSVVAGLQILSKYYEDDDISRFFYGNYDFILLNKYDDIQVSDEDKGVLLSIGWCEDDKCWSI